MMDLLIGASCASQSGNAKQTLTASRIFWTRRIKQRFLAGNRQRLSLMRPLKTAHQRAGTADKGQNAAAVLAPGCSGWSRLMAAVEPSQLNSSTQTLASAVKDRQSVDVLAR
jgi:hypothetical protein